MTKIIKNLPLNTISHTQKDKNNTILKKAAIVMDKDKVESNNIIRKRILLVATQVADIINRKKILTISPNRITRKRNTQRLAEVEETRVDINSINSRTKVMNYNNTLKNTNIHRKRDTLKMRAKKKLKSL